MAQANNHDNQTIEDIAKEEDLLYEIHRHWFGLVKVYVVAALGFVAVMIMAWYLAPIVKPNSEASVQHALTTTVGITTAIAIWLSLLLYTYIYRQSKLIVTNKNLTQVIRSSLFARRVSELSMSNVEDVTANHKGVFASILNFGNMEVETAGARENFIFTYCPNPDYYGNIILEARQTYARSDTTK